MSWSRLSMSQFFLVAGIEKEQDINNFIKKYEALKEDKRNCILRKTK